MSVTCSYIVNLTDRQNADRERIGACVVPGERSLHHPMLDTELQWVPPKQWRDADGPCPTCRGQGVRITPESVGRAFSAVLERGRGAGVQYLICPDCRDGKPMVELRVPCPACEGSGLLPIYEDMAEPCVNCMDGWVVVARATVTLLPVVERASVDWSATPMVTVNTPTGVVRRWWDDSGSYEELTLDPLPVPGRHFVAVVTP